MDSTTLLQALNDLFNWLAKHKDIKMPFMIGIYPTYIKVSYSCDNKKEFIPLAKSLTNVSKDYSDNTYFYLRGNISDLVRVVTFSNRKKVCKATIVGKKIIEREIPATYETIREEVDDIKWECEPLLDESNTTLEESNTTLEK